MLFALLAVSAIVPSLLLMWFFHAQDVYRDAWPRSAQALATPVTAARFWGSLIS